MTKTRHRDAHNQGNGAAELQLWCAVLLNVIEDAQRTITDGMSVGDRADIISARDYLTKPNRDFNLVCSLAGLDPTAVRDRLLFPFKEHAPTYATTQTRGRPAMLHTFNGEALTVDQWAIKTGINMHTLHSRLEKGWTIDRALTTPARQRNRRQPGVGNDLSEVRGTGAPRHTQGRAQLEFLE
jgi:hypothetical protein